MRELWETGYMHNRARMVVGSFLVKHLLINWKIGYAWFEYTLIDFDPANNAMGWQWVTGSGIDSRSEEHTSELQSRGHLVCRLLLEKKNKNTIKTKPMMRKHNS